MKIKRMISSGNVSPSRHGEPKTSSEVIEWLEDSLESSLSDLNSEIGYVIFEGEDGKLYRMYTVIEPEEIDQEYADELMNEGEDSQYEVEL